MKEFEINAIAIKENGGYYMVRHLFTYENIATIKECYKQLYIWSHHYENTIMQYCIKNGNQIVEDKILISSLGIDIIPKDSCSTKSQLERIRLALVKALRNKLGPENN